MDSCHPGLPVTTHHSHWQQKYCGPKLLSGSYTSSVKVYFIPQSLGSLEFCNLGRKFVPKHIYMNEGGVMWSFKEAGRKAAVCLMVKATERKFLLQLKKDYWTE
ncbi:unnamed protein product [Eretmochelys imbricata]